MQEDIKNDTFPPSVTQCRKFLQSSILQLKLISHGICLICLSLAANNVHLSLWNSFLYECIFKLHSSPRRVEELEVHIARLTHRAAYWREAALHTAAEIVVGEILVEAGAQSTLEHVETEIELLRRWRWREAITGGEIQLASIFAGVPPRQILQQECIVVVDAAL